MYSLVINPIIIHSAWFLDIFIHTYTFLRDVIFIMTDAKNFHGFYFLRSPVSAIESYDKGSIQGWNFTDNKVTAKSAKFIPLEFGSLYIKLTVNMLHLY